MKYTVEEFRDMEIVDILGCIGDDIEIGTRPVDAGLSNLGRVKGTITEDNIPGEGIIYYDIRFIAYLKEKEMRILINIDYSDFRIIPIISCFLALRLYFSQENRNNYCI